MIHDFEKWVLKESFGDGVENFTEKIDVYGKMKNIDFISCPSAWGESISDATGELSYSVSLELNSSGIESINFSIDRIVLDIEVVTGYDEDSYEIMGNIEYVVEKKDIKTDVKVEVNNLPFYLNTLTIDFSQAENLDGDFLPEKVKFEMEIGKIEQ